MLYALIKNNTVENIIELHPSNAKDFPNAIAADPNITGGVGIGDEYHDGRFYRDGELVRNTYELQQETFQEMADMQAALELLGIAPEVDDE